MLTRVNVDPRESHVDPRVDPRESHGSVDPRESHGSGDNVQKSFWGSGTMSSHTTY